MSFGIQRELGWRTAAEARYVGTFGRDIWRGVDYNQITIGSEFQADFLRARSNGFLAQAAGLGFNPAFNATVAGSQPLTLIPNFGGGLLTSSTVISNIQTNQVAGLADFYITNRVAGALQALMPNGSIYAADGIINGGFSNYHSLQLELRRQFRGGFFAQANYTFANTRSNSDGTTQSRLEPLLDNARPQLNEGRSSFHVTHALNANAIVELPFGAGKRWLDRAGLVGQLAGDWQLSTIVRTESGAPITIYSGRGTFNRPGRSSCANVGCNMAFTPLSDQELRGLFGIFTQPDGRLYWIDPKVIDPSTGRAVGADSLTNSAGFAGQVFFNPTAGNVGNLEILSFDGPKQFVMDLSISKRVRFLQKYSVELRGEAFNLLNKPSFFIGDMDINSATFGRITSVNVASRVVQLSARFEF